MSDTHDELAHFQSLWDAALEKMEMEPIHPQQEKPAQEVPAVELIQERRESSEQQLDLRDMLILSEDIDRVFHPERYEEVAFNDKSTYDQKVASDIVMKQAASPNPIRGGTAGRSDQEPAVTPNFMDSDALRELSDVKMKVEELERKVHAAEIQGQQKQENSFNKQLSNLRSKVEELSDKLLPHRLMGADAES